MTDEDLAHVRRRPGMYVGSRGSGGVRHLVLEVVSNSFDVVLAGAASSVTVTVGRDGVVQVHDDGPGMEVHDRSGPTFEELFTTYHRTATADGHFPHLHLHPGGGLGLGPVCALSAELHVTVRRADATYRQAFARGRAVSDLVRTGPEGRTGTTIRLLPDPDVFEVTAPAVADGLAEVLREIAFLHPGLVTRLEVEGRTPRVVGPVADLVPAFDHAFAGQRHPLETAPMRLATVDDRHAVEVVLAWSTHRHGTDLLAFANHRRIDEQARIVQGFEEGLRAVLGQGPMDDAMEGLRAVTHIQLVEPALPGPTGRRLDDPEAIWRLADTIASQLPARLARHADLLDDLRSRVPTRERVIPRPLW